MKIGFASDHRGYLLKRKLIEHFTKEGIDCFDVGAFNEEKSDYPVYAFKLGEKINSKTYDFGVAICGSGIGISIAANKVKGVRAAKVDSSEEAKYARIDNDANVVTFSAETELEKAIELVVTFISTEREDVERHDHRVSLITQYEEDGHVS